MRFLKAILFFLASSSVTYLILAFYQHNINILQWVDGARLTAAFLFFVYYWAAVLTTTKRWEL